MKSGIVLILTVGILLVSCNSNVPVTPPVAGSLSSPSPTEQLGPTSTQVLPTSTANVIIPTEISNPDCANDDVNKIGRSIANSYPFTTTAEVMTWFCEGAEFEDIMVALETEELNGTAAEEMLQMRAEGLSWDDIWQVVGFIDK
jgi:hypothetical protein